MYPGEREGILRDRQAKIDARVERNKEEKRKKNLAVDVQAQLEKIARQKGTAGHTQKERYARLEVINQEIAAEELARYIGACVKMDQLPHLDNITEIIDNAEFGRRVRLEESMVDKQAAMDPHFLTTIERRRHGRETEDEMRTYRKETEILSRNARYEGDEEGKR